jgi:hypothetical protein
VRIPSRGDTLPVARPLSELLESCNKEIATVRGTTPSPVSSHPPAPVGSGRRQPDRRFHPRGSSLPDALGGVI